MYGVIIMEVLPHILSSLRLQNSHSNFQEIQESTSILWACNLRLTILHPFLGLSTCSSWVIVTTTTTTTTTTTIIIIIILIIFIYLYSTISIKIMPYTWCFTEIKTCITIKKRLANRLSLSIIKAGKTKLSTNDIKN